MIRLKADGNELRPTFHPCERGTAPRDRGARLAEVSAVVAALRLRSERSPTDTIPARRLLGSRRARTVICECDCSTGRGTKSSK